jgi:hypothetical protein
MFAQKFQSIMDKMVHNNSGYKSFVLRRTKSAIKTTRVSPRYIHDIALKTHQIAGEKSTI